MSDYESEARKAAAEIAALGSVAWNLKVERIRAILRAFAERVTAKSEEERYRTVCEREEARDGMAAADVENARLKARFERLREHLKTRHGCDNFDAFEEPDYGL